MAKIALGATARVHCSTSTALEPGQDQKPHTHDDQDKIYVVLEGRGRFTVGAAEETLEPGEAVVAAAGAAHGVVNDSDARLLAARARVAAAAARVTPPAARRPHGHLPRGHVLSRGRRDDRAAAPPARRRRRRSRPARRAAACRSSTPATTRRRPPSPGARSPCSRTRSTSSSPRDRARGWSSTSIPALMADRAARAEAERLAGRTYELSQFLVKRARPRGASAAPSAGGSRTTTPVTSCAACTSRRVRARSCAT